MVQYNLPAREKKRPQPEGPQVASVVSEAAEAAPKLLLYLAKKMHGGGGDPRSIYKSTGWYQDVDGQWLYSTGDQKLKVREDNPLLSVSKQGPTYGVKPTDTNQPGPDIKQFEKPGLPMKKEPGEHEGYSTQSKGLLTIEDDPNAQVIPLLSQQQKRYPEMPWASQQPPGAPAYIENRMKLYPDMYPVDDQLSFQDTVPSGPENYEFWEQWAQPKTDYSKVRINEQRGPTAEQLFSHDTLFDLTPELRDVRMAGSHYTHGGPQDYRGSYIDMGPGLIEATGSLGGVKLPNSMESVALHEFGHKGQRVYGMPRGGNPDEGGMDMRGDMMAIDAGQRFRDLLTLENEEVAKLVNLGIPADQAENMVADFYPNIEAMKKKYSTVSASSPNDPNIASGQFASVEPKYLGYRGEAGEAQSKNLQTRAATLRNDLPMTGEKPWQQFPYGHASGGEETHRFLNDRDTELAKPHEGDIHPFDTYQIPPDLTRLRTDMPHGGRREVMPKLGEYDWMLKKPAAFGVGAATPSLMGGDEAQAAPTGGRIGEPTKNEVMDQRLALARQQSQSADQRATGATSPEPPRDDAMTPWNATKSLMSGARSAAEGAAGTFGDFSVDTGLGFKLPLSANVMPGQADIAKVTDRYMPEPIQSATRFESKNPVEQAWKWLAEALSF